MSDFAQYPWESNGGHNRYLSLHERISPPGVVCCTIDGQDVSRDVEVVGIADQPIIPTKDWEEFSLRSKVWWDLDKTDQDGYSLCWLASLAQAVMLMRECAGLPRVYLSFAGLCGLYTGGQNRGGGLDESLGAAMEIGIPPCDLTPNDNINPRTFPAGTKEAAKSRRVIQAYDCLSSQVFEKLVSGVLRGRPGAFGMFWGRGAHALCIMGLARRGNEWVADVLGSWGAKAHEGDGTLKLSASQMRGVNTFGGYVLGLSAMEDDETKPPSLK